MSIKIFNSLSNKKEKLKPLNGNVIKMYSCGVTVYDQSHIGHARSLYTFDVIKKYLSYRGFNVKLVRNITDIDDKIINKAKELNKDWKKVVRENIELYEKDLKDLGIDHGWGKENTEPRATENIDLMIKHIEGLIEKGYAYEADGDVYFSVRKFKDYGKLSGQSIEKMLEAVRIEQDTKKKDSLDFALWKKSKEGEPSWSSPWGEGRPGWHIECSCMSMHHLDCETLDIHAGGRDLIFPHHENEVAQSEALTGKPFAKYWIHHGLLTINSQKMAKSLGNFITIQDAIEKFTVNGLKIFFLSSHYGSPIDFTEDKLHEANKALNKISILLNKVEKINQSEKDIKLGENNDFDILENYKSNFIDAMDDDFNTPKALGVIFELINETNKYIDNNKNDNDYVSNTMKVAGFIEEICIKIFGINNLTSQESLSEEEKGLLEERIEARKNKDFKRSDEIRDRLKEIGIIVEDTKDGQDWRRE